MQEEDVLILISKGGNTQELVNLIPACRTKQALLIGVSENPDSAIAREADIYLRVKVARGALPLQHACHGEHAGGHIRV